jgi:hypothetical protein
MSMSDGNAKTQFIYEHEFATQILPISLMTLGHPETIFPGNLGTDDIQRWIYML